MQDAAREYVEAMLSQWADAGGDPTALLIEMARFIADVQGAAK